MQANRNFGRAAGTMLLTAALAALLSAQTAVAQDTKPAAKPAAKTTSKSKANLMTRDELRACMNEQDRLQALSKTIEQEQTALDSVKAQVQAADAELQKKLAALDPADEAGRKALEGEGAQRDKVADDYNARLAGLRQQASDFNTGRQAWVEQCTNKDFDEMDEAAVKKERQQAARAGKK